MAVILPASFAMGVGITVFMLGFNFYLRDQLRVSKSQLGGMFALWQVTYVLSCLTLGPLVDRFRPREVVTLATAIISVASLAITMVRSLIWVGLFFMLMGMGTALFWPPIMGWAARGEEGRTLRGSLAKFNLSWSTANLFGTLAAGWLSAWHLMLPLWSASALLFLTCVFMISAARFFPHLRDDVSVPKDTASTECDERGRTFWRFPAWVGLFTAFTASGVIGNIFPVFGREELLFSKQEIGALLFVRALAMILAFTTIGRMVFWNYRVWPMLVGQASYGVALILLSLARGALAVGGLFFLTGMLTSMAYSSSLFHGAAGAARRAGRAAIHESLLACGVVVGSAGGGMIYEATGRMVSVYFFAAGVVLIGLIPQAILCILAVTRERTPR